MSPYRLPARRRERPPPIRCSHCGENGPCWIADVRLAFVPWWRAIVELLVG